MPIDPRNSRPFDVHRWPDDPEVRELVNQVWDEFFQPDEGPRPGPKPKIRHKDMPKVLLLDLYLAWSTDPGQSVGIHLGFN